MGKGKVIISGLAMMKSEVLRFHGAAVRIWRIAGKLPRQGKMIRGWPEFIEGWDKYKGVN